MTKRMIIMLSALGLLFGLIIAYKAFGTFMIKKFMAGMSNPTFTVSTIKAEMQDWQPKLEAVGSTRAVQGADLSSEVAGIVEEIKFESGSDVATGAVLVQLRAENDIATLQAYQAAAKLAAVNFERDQKQLKAQAVSQATVDTDEATLRGAEAQVASQQAMVDKKTIKAPFAGHLGIRQVDVGQYLNPGTAIVTLQQLDPIFVDFNLPERALTQLSLGQKAVAHVDAHSGKNFDGEITAINSKIDEATRNIQVRASFKNPDRMLLPGMFARISIETGAPVKYVTLPSTAITYNPYGNTVFVVAPKAEEDKEGEEKPAKDGDKAAPLVATQVFVTTGETRGDQIAIVKGIKPGDEIVTTGQVKLRNGASVAVNNEITPSNDPAPKIQDR